MTASLCLSAERVSTSSRWTVYITSYSTVFLFSLLFLHLFTRSSSSLLFLSFFLLCCPPRLFVSLYILSHESLFRSAICFSVFPLSGLSAAPVGSTRRRCLWAVVSCRPAVNSEQRLTERVPDLLVFMTSASQRVLKGVSGSTTPARSLSPVWLELGGNIIR